MKKNNWLRWAVCLSTAALIAGCSRGNNADDFVEPDPAPILYQRALAHLQAGDNRTAAEAFEEVDRQHPASVFAQRALLMSAYAHYEGGQFDDAEEAARRYIPLHPGNEEAAYAQYLIAQSRYQQVGDVTRDQTRAREALRAFTEITRLYPDSKYAPEAERRRELLLDHLAGKEMEVGRFYLGRQNYLAAINRFKVVLTEYQTTRHVEEALLRMTEAYLALGVVNEAQTAAAILGHNYPDSPWFERAYALLNEGGLEPREDSGSWLGRNWRRLRGA